MYGLGIRIAVYTQRFGAVPIGHMNHVNETSIPSIRILGILLTVAITLPLIIQIVRQALQAADIYVTLLLATGIYCYSPQILEGLHTLWASSSPRSGYSVTNSLHKYDEAWRLVCTFSNATVVSALVAAVELTIKWNKIRGVNTVDTVVQMAPLLLSFIAVLRALFDTCEFSNKEDQDEESPPPPEARTRMPPPVPPPPPLSTSNSSPSSSSRKASPGGRGLF
ncbi:hypothetical protein ACO1O0_006037 [Amphichorda felina]